MGVAVELPASVYGAEALKRAAYVLMGRATVTIAETASGWCCTLDAAPDEDLDHLERDFRREVLDQDLRLSIEAKTEPMRTAILGLAFSRTGLQGE